MTASRRSLLFGLGASFICAPAIVRASSLMPVKAFVDRVPLLGNGVPPGATIEWALAQWGPNGELISGVMIDGCFAPSPEFVAPEHRQIVRRAYEKLYAELAAA